MKALDSVSYGAGALGLLNIMANEINGHKVLEVVADAKQNYGGCFKQYDVSCGAIYEKMFCNHYLLGVALEGLDASSRLHFYRFAIDYYQIGRNITYGYLMIGGLIGLDLLHRAFWNLSTKKMRPATLVDRVTYGVESLFVGYSALVSYIQYYGCSLIYQMHDECSSLIQVRDFCENQQKTIQGSCRQYQSSLNWVKQCIPDHCEDHVDFLCSNMAVNYVAGLVLSIVSADLLHRSLSGYKKTRIFSFVATGCAGFAVANYFNK